MADPVTAGIIAGAAVGYGAPGILGTAATAGGAATGAVLGGGIGYAAKAMSSKGTVKSPAESLGGPAVKPMTEAQLERGAERRRKRALLRKRRASLATSLSLGEPTVKKQTLGA